MAHLYIYIVMHDAVTRVCCINL